MGTLTQQENVVPAERHCAVIEVAQLWNLSPDKVREIFEHEPSVSPSCSGTKVFELLRNITHHG
jgi:hypothetical protein